MNVYSRAALAFSAYLAAIAACLFLGAGRADIPEFWVYLGLYAGLGVVSFPLLDRDLMQERMRPGGEAPSWRLFGAAVVMVGQFLVAGVDRGHLRTGGSVPLAWRIAGFVVVAAGWAVALWATAVNPFFSSVARLQPDRGQRVIDTGPYRVVRHPAYAAMLVGAPATGLALGSWLAAATGVVLMIPLILWRAIPEDRMLMTGLPGYADYAARVRWRLVPGVW